MTWAPLQPTKGNSVTNFEFQSTADFSFDVPNRPANSTFSTFWKLIDTNTFIPNCLMNFFSVFYDMKVNEHWIWFLRTNLFFHGCFWKYLENSTQLSPIEYKKHFQEELNNLWVNIIKPKNNVNFYTCTPIHPISKVISNFWPVSRQVGF